METSNQNPDTLMTQGLISCSDSDSDVCPVCGVDRAERTIKVFDDVVIRVPIGCDCEIAQSETEMKRIRSYEQRQRWSRILKNSGLTPGLRKKTLASFKRRPGTEQALQVTSEYIADIKTRVKTGEGILYLGKPGNGKTHLAAAIVNAALEQKIPASIQDVPSLLSRIRYTYGKNAVESEDQVLRFLEEVKILVLDDLGKESTTDWAHEKLYTLINSRYVNQRATIITSNFELNDLMDRLGEAGEAMVDRLMERCRLVINKGTSYRREKAMARLQRDYKISAAGD